MLLAGVRVGGKEPFSNTQSPLSLPGPALRERVNQGSLSWENASSLLQPALAILSHQSGEMLGRMCDVHSPEVQLTERDLPSWCSSVVEP